MWAVIFMVLNHGTKGYKRGTERHGLSLLPHCLVLMTEKGGHERFGIRRDAVGCTVRTHCSFAPLLIRSAAAVLSVCPPVTTQGQPGGPSCLARAPGRTLLHTLSHRVHSASKLQSCPFSPEPSAALCEQKFESTTIISIQLLSKPPGYTDLTLKLLIVSYLEAS